MKIKLYLETSVWNFYYADDTPEKKEITRQFLDSLPSSRYEIYISDVVVREVNRASDIEQKQLFSLIAKHNLTRLKADENAEILAQQYLKHIALPRKSVEDARHVAIATVNELNAVISWNMRHIASLYRQEKVQAINLLNGYTKPIQLVTPFVVSENETDEN